MFKLVASIGWTAFVLYSYFLMRGDHVDRKFICDIVGLEVAVTCLIIAI